MTEKTLDRDVMLALLAGVVQAVEEERTAETEEAKDEAFKRALALIREFESKAGIDRILRQRGSISLARAAEILLYAH